jgi:hypothetical protein
MNVAGINSSLGSSGGAMSNPAAGLSLAFHPLPRPAMAEIDQQVAVALPLLREALIEEGEDA